MTCFGRIWISNGTRISQSVAITVSQSVAITYLAIGCNHCAGVYFKPCDFHGLKPCGLGWRTPLRLAVEGSIALRCGLRGTVAQVSSICVSQ
jgi:hypothetical protein